MDAMRSERWYAGKAWVVIAVLALLVTLFGVYVLFSPVDSGDFESETGFAYDTFSSTSPAIADYLEREARVLAVTSIAFGLLAAGVAYGLLRKRDRIGWTLSWLFAGWLGLVSIVFFAASAAGLGSFYAIAAVVAGAAIFVSGPTVKEN